MTDQTQQGNTDKLDPIDEARIKVLDCLMQLKDAWEGDDLPVPEEARYARQVLEELWGLELFSDGYGGQKWGRHDPEL